MVPIDLAAGTTTAAAEINRLVRRGQQMWPGVQHFNPSIMPTALPSRFLLTRLAVRLDSI